MAKIRRFWQFHPIFLVEATLLTVSPEPLPVCQRRTSGTSTTGDPGVRVLAKWKPDISPSRHYHRDQWVISSIQPDSPDGHSRCGVIVSSGCFEHSPSAFAGATRRGNFEMVSEYERECISCLSQALEGPRQVFLCQHLESWCLADVHHDRFNDRRARFFVV